MMEIVYYHALIVAVAACSVVSVAQAAANSSDVNVTTDVTTVVATIVGETTSASTTVRSDEVTVNVTEANATAVVSTTSTARATTSADDVNVTVTRNNETTAARVNVDGVTTKSGTTGGDANTTTEAPSNLIKGTSRTAADETTGDKTTFASLSTVVVSTDDVDADVDNVGPTPNFAPNLAALNECPILSETCPENVSLLFNASTRPCKFDCVGRFRCANSNRSEIRTCELENGRFSWGFDRDYCSFCERAPLEVDTTAVALKFLVILGTIFFASVIIGYVINFFEERTRKNERRKRRTRLTKI